MYLPNITLCLSLPYLIENSNDYTPRDRENIIGLEPRFLSHKKLCRHLVAQQWKIRREFSSKIFHLILIL